MGWWALRRPRPAGAVSEQHAFRQIIRETLHNAHALFAFFGLSNADVIVARNVLDSHSAGLYAGGLILTKAVLFLPQFVVVIAFPDMAAAHEWYESEDYAPLKALRQSASDTNIILVDGT